MNNDLISRSALLADLREKGFLPAIVQRAIERAPTVDAVEIPPTGVGDLSDGYHTFNELYHHRAILFSVICNNHPEIAWKSMHHNDPNSPMYDGMFIVGIETPQGQATYHYDIDPYWDMFKVKELDRAPAWDGHTPDEAIRRIELLGDVSPAADAVDAVDCVHMTNAQKIRAMSDEELAEFIRSIVDGSNSHNVACYGCINYGTHHSDPANKGTYLYECDGCENEGIGLDVLMWLQQPAEEVLTMAEWKVYEADTPQCTSCGMWMPFARYRRGHGVNARKITDYCPNCGMRMTAMPMCGDCKYGQGAWKDDGICYACRGQVWIPGKPHRKVGEER